MGEFIDKCEEYRSLSGDDRELLNEVINRRMCGKSHIAAVLITVSDLPGYDFYVSVWKFSPRTERGWATNGFARRNKYGEWSISMNPIKAAKEHIGRSEKYS